MTRLAFNYRTTLQDNIKEDCSNLVITLYKATQLAKNRLLKTHCSQYSISTCNNSALLADTLSQVKSSQPACCISDLSCWSLSFTCLRNRITSSLARPMYLWCSECSASCWFLSDSRMAHAAFIVLLQLWTVAVNQSGILISIFKLFTVTSKV